MHQHRCVGPSKVKPCTAKLRNCISIGRGRAKKLRDQLLNKGRFNSVDRILLNDAGEMKSN